MWLPIVVFCSLMVSSRTLEVKFPPGFEFGTATSSYQVEGAWNVSDKGESTCDRFTHTRPEVMADGSNGDVACDSYHLWARDVDMLAELGVHFYRFSIEWTRLLPTGFPNKISKDGFRYYNNLINALIDKNIKPIITLNHYSLPQRLQNLGGWANPLSSDWFADYARVAYSLFGDRVETWVTINEPTMLCHIGYGMGALAPGVRDPEIGAYLCAKHVLLAHAKAWRAYDEEFRAKYHGKVSMSNIIFWPEPSDSDEDSKNLTEIVRQFHVGMYSHPIYSKEGGWPPLIEKLMEERSRTDGYTVSRLPPFTEEERKLVQGTHDFYGLNYYTGYQVRRAKPGESPGEWPFTGLPDFDIILDGLKLPQPHGIAWFYYYPEGLRKSLRWVKEQYGDVDVFITENGHPQSVLGLNDDFRSTYIKEHLEQILLAILEDNVTVSKYTMWSLMDVFEWAFGYTCKFGLYEVDFSSPQRTRTPRGSARYYADVIKAHSLHLETTET